MAQEPETRRENIYSLLLHGLISKTQVSLCSSKKKKENTTDCPYHVVFGFCQTGLALDNNQPASHPVLTISFCLISDNVRALISSGIQEVPEHRIGREETYSLKFLDCSDSFKLWCHKVMPIPVSRHRGFF
jgi:hypothetical protein